MGTHRPKREMILLFLIQAQHHTVLAQSSELTNQYPTILTPSMALIIVVLLVAFFFLGFLSVYVRHCTSDSSTRRRPSAARGLDSSVIDTFPLLHYSEVKGLKIGKGALECAVCLNEFDDDETLRFIPKCDHVFHYNCIDAWLASHVTCPVCRADLGSSPDRLAESTHLEAGNESGRVERRNELNESINNSDVEVREGREEESLNRSRTRGWWFLKSHSTGHSSVQPGENTDRFTLKLPGEVRQQIMNRKLDRTMSLVEFPRERSRRSGDGNSSGKYRRLEKLGEPADRSDRWVFTRNPSFLTRASSFLTRASSSIIRSSSLRSTKVTVNDGEGTSVRPVGPDVKESSRPSV